MKSLDAVMVILALLVSSIANSQVFTKQDSEEKASFQSIQEEFRAWSEGKDLSNEKGWKWYKRWEHHYEQRTNARGELVPSDVFLGAAVKAAEAKSSRADDDADWMPAGPDYLPSSPNPVSGHGVSRINCVTFHPTEENTFWIGASQGGIWKTTDNGANWTPLNEGLPILRISDLTVDPTNTDIMYACMGDFEYNGFALDLNDRKRHTHYGLGVYKTTDGGLTWNPTGLTVMQEDLDYSLLRRLLIDPDNTDHLVVGGFEGIWRSEDAGDSWTNVMPDLIISDVEQDPSNPQVLYAGSTYINNLQDGTTGVLKSTDFGETWNWLQTGMPVSGSIGRVELAIAPSNTDYIYAHCVNLYGGLYGIYRSTEAGQGWELMTDNDTPNIMHWFEGGGSGGQGTYDLAFVVHPEDEEKIYSGGVNMWGSEDGGENWSGMSYWVNYYGISIHADQHQFKFNPLNNRLYVVNDGGIMYTDDPQLGSWDDAYDLPDYEWPTQWTNISSGMQITSFYRLGLSANNPGYVIAGSQDNSTFYYDNNEWINIIGGDGMEALLHPDYPERLIGSSQYGSISRSFDGGQNIEYGLANPMLNAEDGEWTTPFFHSPSNEAVYAGFGNVWKSTDFGGSWSPISDFDDMPGSNVPPLCSFITQSTQNPQTIYVAKRLLYSLGVNSEMWVTHDEGDSWAEITDGLPDELYFTYVAVDGNDPNLAWVTCSGFEEGVKVFRTSNGGETWENISYDLPNIPVNTVAVDENSANHTVYIGTDIGVYRTSDDIDYWETFSHSLPNVIVSELEFDYLSGDLYCSTFGRGIWRTGYETVTSTQDVDSDLLFEVYPNPTEGIINISLSASGGADASLRVFDVMGKMVKDIPLQSVETSSLVLDLSKFGPGVYFLEYREGRISKSERIVVQ